MLSAARQAGVSVQGTRVGTMFSLFLTSEEPRNWSTVRACDTDRFAEFFRRMLDRGVYLAPSQFEASFLSTTHGDEVIRATLDAARQTFAGLT
ncbi:MAG: hypothetical protein WD906_02110 [Anaerolineales bacterium]